MLADSLCLTCTLIQLNTDACLTCKVVQRHRPAMPAPGVEPLSQDQQAPKEDTFSEEEQVLLADLMTEGDLFSG